MPEGDKVPVLFELLFGEAAERAQDGASERLKRWAAAFDDWLEQLQKPWSRWQARDAWRNLLRHQPKMPWKYTPSDLQRHIAWLQSQGYADSTIYNPLHMLEDFYRWCAQRQVDPLCEPAFNPLAGVQRPKKGRYARLKLLSRREVQALLDVLRADPSPLGKRDLAFVLLRLHTGVPLACLRCLQWGQIQPDAAAAWVCWLPPISCQDPPPLTANPSPPGSSRSRLPPEVWQAILDWLRASGRLAHMQPHSYIFAPLAGVLREQDLARAEAWVEGRPLTTGQIRRNCQLFGRLAGIAGGDLTLRALQGTAIRWKLEQTASATAEGLAEVRSFMHSRSATSILRFRLKFLPALPSEEPQPVPLALCNSPAPRRMKNIYQPGDGLRHGLYASGLPPDEVQAVLGEGVEGLGDEIVGLRMLERELLRRMDGAGMQEMLLLGQAYTLAATRLARLIEAERLLEKQNKPEGGVQQRLARLDEAARRMGLPPVSEALYAKARQSEPGAEASGRHLGEEVATVRAVLRRALSLASEAQETKELLRLVDVYSVGCSRLVRMLLVRGAQNDRLKTLLDEAQQQALREVMQELGLYI